MPRTAPAFVLHPAASPPRRSAVSHTPSAHPHHSALCRRHARGRVSAPLKCARARDSSPTRVLAPDHHTDPARDVPPDDTTKATTNTPAATSPAAPAVTVRRDTVRPLAAVSGVLVLLAVDRLLRRAFAALSWQFPAPLAGMLALFAGLLALRRASPAAADGLVARFSPATTFIGRWLAVLFCPTLVILPLSAAPPLPDITKLACIIVGGLLFSMVSTASTSLLLRRISAPPPLPSADPAAPPARPWRPRARTVLAFLAVALLSLLLALSFPAARVPVLAGSLAATLFGFSAAQYLPPRVKKVAHPLILAAVGAGAAIVALGGVTGVGWRAVMGGYLTRGKAAPGAGDLLMGLLGPAILSFAFEMYSRRELLQRHSLSVFGTTLVASAASLFGTAFAARALNTSMNARLYAVPRMVTAPLAVCIAEVLGTDPAMAGSIVTLTGVLGANFCLLILDALRIRDPVARGLASGSSAHGLGTAATVHEPSAFPFAVIAMALVGTYSTLLVSIPSVRAALLYTALGRAAGVGAGVGL